MTEGVQSGGVRQVYQPTVERAGAQGLGKRASVGSSSHTSQATKGVGDQILVRHEERQPTRRAASREMPEDIPMPEGLAPKSAIIKKQIPASNIKTSPATKALIDSHIKTLNGMGRVSRDQLQESGVATRNLMLMVARDKTINPADKERLLRSVNAFQERVGTNNYSIFTSKAGNGFFAAHLELSAAAKGRSIHITPAPDNPTTKKADNLSARKYSATQQAQKPFSSHKAEPAPRTPSDSGVLAAAAVILASLFTLA